MQVGTGKSILNGIAIGKLKIYKKKDTAISAAEVADTAAEVARFEEAQQKAIEQQTALYEKALAGYVKYLDTYMYFDKDGYVVESSGIRTQGVPQITGLAFNHIVLGEQLPVENPEVFAGIMDMTKLLNKYQLTADKIYFHSSGEITIYFGQIKVAMGSDNSHLEDKLQLLPGFLEQLEGKSGTLQMENYEEGKGKFTFKPDA